MKKIVLSLFVLTSCFSFASCSKAPDKGSQDANGCGCCADCSEEDYKQSGNCDCCSDCEYTTSK